ncbi:MAG: MFS transporter [Pseudomonadota bacterium]
MTPQPSNPDKPLFFQRRFLPMWTALALGAFTDNMLKQALSIGLVFGIFTAPLISNDDALPIIGSLFPIAMLLFSTIAGQVADKYETAKMFRLTKFAEFLLMAMAAIGFLIGNTPILILSLFLMGAQSAFFSPVRTGAMPKYLYADELVRGNAICGGGLFVSIMIGIVLGGVLIAQPSGPAIVSAVLIIAALIGWLVIRLAPEAAANAPDLQLDWNAFAQAKRLAGFALNARGVSRPLLGVAWYWSVGALVSVATPFFVRDILKGDETVVAFMMGLFAIGAALGSTLAAAVSKGRSALGFSTIGAFSAGFMTLILYVAAIYYEPPQSSELLNLAALFNQWPAYVIASTFILASISTSLFVVPLQAAVQRRAPAAQRSRILSANNMANAAGAMVGSWLVLFVTRTPLGADEIFLAVGVAQFLLAGYMIARARVTPRGLYDEMLLSNAPALREEKVES